MEEFKVGDRVKNNGSGYVQECGDYVCLPVVSGYITDIDGETILVHWDNTMEPYSILPEPTSHNQEGIEMEEFKIGDKVRNINTGYVREDIGGGHGRGDWHCSCA